MAPLRPKAPTNFGSTQWILSEREQVLHLADQDAEEFAFSARNEVDWLNEHMAEIFDENQLNIAEIFKTPGKLRGKTPRTARKRNALEVRAPLTDVFSINQQLVQSPSHQTQFYKQVAHFQVAEDPILKAPTENADAEKPPQAGKGNTDSGYHGMSEDEMDVEPAIQKPEPLATSEPYSPGVRPSGGHKDVQMSVERSSQGQRTTEGSFHSAKEVPSAKIAPKPDSQEDIDMEGDDDDEALLIPSQSLSKQDQSIKFSQPKSASPPNAAPSISATVLHPEKDSMLEDIHTIDDMRSPSEGSSPVRALVRKSSLTFASLPAREPLATKKSIGARNSRTSHLDQSKMAATSRGSYFGRHTDGKSLGGFRQPQPVEEADGGEEMDVDEESMPPSQLTTEKSIADATMMELHNKSSTQRLHEKINMLGQSQPTRPTKSIPSIAAVTAHLNYPDLPRAESEQLADVLKGHGPLRQTHGPDVQIVADDDEDDWIQPPPQVKIGKPPQVTKRHSTDAMEEMIVKHSINGKEIKPSVASSTKGGSRQASPLRHAAVPARPMNPAVHAKAASTSVVASPPKVARAQGTGHKKSLSISNPALASVQGEAPITTTTPAGTPKAKRNVEGPLNASKAKLQSIMKGARGLFTSSAGISAQAKMETISPPYLRSPGQDYMSSMDENLGGTKVSSSASGIPDPEFNTVGLAVVEAPARRGSTPKKAEGRKTRSSTEKEERRKEKEAKEREQAEEEVSTAQEQERQKIAADAEEKEKERAVAREKLMVKQGENRVAKGNQSQRQTRHSPRKIQYPEELGVGAYDTEVTDRDVEMVDCPQPMAPPPPRDQPQTSQMQKPKDIRRPIKPAKETAPKPKPQPVAIRVGTLSQRVPLSNSALSSTLQDSLPPSAAPPVPKQPSLAKKASLQSLQSSISNPSLKSSVSSMSTKPKALLAAERKKEQDEKEAQRKLEQKREIERKRAAQQEEARRQEQQQRREAERQREKDRAILIEEPKKTAQKQAIEKRRLENAKKAEQQRNQLRPGNDLEAHALQQEKAQPAPAPHRGELGNTRPPSRMNSVQDFSRPVAAHPLPNVAKPAKRPAEDEPFQRPAITKAGAVSQANDVKRRRTDDEDVQEAQIRPTIAPPIRQSNIRKDAPKPSIFSHGYTSAPPPPSIAHATPSLLKSTTNNQFQLYHQQQQMLSSKPVQPMDMAKGVTGKIPFAEAPNPPHPSYRTPLPSKQPAVAAAKSSPNYPNGDAIDLPEIATDSEDEDSDDGANTLAPPDWANSPQLREILEHQQCVDPEQIFGPMVPPQMEKMFTNKDRHHRFRSRTSSANWNGQDRLTEEEIRTDVAAREKMRREGGWTYGL